MDALARFEKTRIEFESYLEKTANEWSFAYPLADAMRYALFTGGKRYRPVLLLSAYQAFGGEINEAVMLFACAVETLHTYSLVHDDLPCMDNDDYRRGQLTCHKKYGETVATLAGDALLNISYELIFKAIRTSGNDEKFVKAGALFSSLTGADGLIGGQIKDLSFNADNGMSELEFIFRNKTCNLIIAAIECGAILGGASETEGYAMRDFAYNFGFAFQIADDILDGETGDGCSVLKVTDEKKAAVMLNDYTDKAISSLDGINRDLEFFKEFALIAKTRVK